MQNSRQLLVSFLFLSVVIHTITFEILGKLSFKVNPPIEKIVEVSFQERNSEGSVGNDKAMRSTHTSVSRKSNKTKSKGSSLAPIKNLLVDPLRFSKNYFKKYNHGDLSTDVGDNPNAPWGQGSKEFGRISDYPILEKIYQRVSNNLYYPGVLAYHKIFGIVKARLVITRTGHCDWHHTQIHAEDKHLKVYILSLLKKTCKQDLKLVTQLRESLNVDMVFNFDLTESPEGLSKSDNYIIGNVLNFYRNYHSSKMEWNLGPFRGLFPIPAVSLDFTWLKNNWDKYIEGEESSPLERFRKDIDDNS